MNTESIVHYVKNPSDIIPRMLVKVAQNQIVPDAVALRLLYRAKVGKRLNLRNPRTFNEKLQWLKLHDRNPLYTTLVDKFAVKKWVADRIGEEYVIPTLGVWDSFDEIDFGVLPERFVLKCTHDSGGLAICRSRASFDVNAARRKIEESIARNFYWHAREWPYKNVQPRIIAEQYLSSDPKTGQVVDYRFNCFEGRARCVFSCSDRAVDDLRVDFFDLGWHHIPLKRSRMDFGKSPERVFPGDIWVFIEHLWRRGSIKKLDLYDVGGNDHLIEALLLPDAGLEILCNSMREIMPALWAELPRGCVIIAGEWVVWLHGEAVESISISSEPSDYKLYRFTDGRIVTLVCEDRHLGKGMSETYYDENWNLLNLTEGGHPAKKAKPSPPHFREMKEIARCLGDGMPFVRVDFYEAPQRPLFGELTFYTAAGFELFDPPEWDARFGAFVDLNVAYGS